MSAIIEIEFNLLYNNFGGFMQYTPFYKDNKQIEFNNLGFSNLKVKCYYSDYENQFMLTNKHYIDFKPRCKNLFAVSSL